MTIEELKSQQAAAEARYNELQVEKNNLETRGHEIDQELLRLQGEYRAFELILTNQAPLGVVAVPADATPLDEETNSTAAKGEVMNKGNK